MKRKTHTTSNVKPSWRKITEGTLYPFPTQRNRRVKHKETIQATAEELGNKINQFELVDPGAGEYKIETTSLPVKEEGSSVTVEPVKSKEHAPDKETYTIQHVGGGWYNVVSSTGKVMNSDKLKSADAQSLRDSLEEETIGDD